MLIEGLKTPTGVIALLAALVSLLAYVFFKKEKFARRVKVFAAVAAIVLVAIAEARAIAADQREIAMAQQQQKDAEGARRFQEKMAEIEAKKHQCLTLESGSHDNRVHGNRCVGPGIDLTASYRNDIYKNTIIDPDSVLPNQTKPSLPAPAAH